MSNGIAVIRAERDWAVRIIGGIIVILLGTLGFMARDIANTLWTVKNNQTGVMTRLDGVEDSMKDLKSEVTDRFYAHEVNEASRGNTRAEYHHSNLGPCITCKRTPDRRMDPHNNPYRKEQFPVR